MKTAILYFVYVALFIIGTFSSGCVSIKDSQTEQVNMSIWKSNSGEDNKSEQATDANASVPFP